MTPWQRFWFPTDDEAPVPTRDFALWSPQAFADTQRALWQQATQANENWWRYWRTAWPGLPAQPAVGMLPRPPAAAVASVAAAAVEPRRKGPSPRPQAKAKAKVSPKPRRGARGH